MTAPASDPRSASYGNTTIFAAGFGLLLLVAALAVLSLVVRDANADALQDKVVPGKISVVGAAKVRTWNSTGFSVQVPAGWGNVATGPVTLQEDELLRQLPTEEARDTARRQFNSRHLVIHRWQGSLDVPEGQTDCTPGAICAEVQVERPVGRRAQSVGDFAIARVRELVADKSLGFDDLGPVTARGGRWVWRWSARLGDQQRTAYFFATCERAKVAEYYQVILRAPSTSNVREQFADLLASITTELPSQPRSEQGREKDCSDVVDR